ncbi:MAG: ATP-binding protein [Bacteroidota bacterium]|nr:ATP-binding protein [Bacteroidota bacterium]
MINREIYTNRLVKFIDKPFIKVLTGLRRSGKSSILLLLKEELQRRGVASENIIQINFESFAYADIQNATDLYDFVKQKIDNTQTYYILLDEIQEIDSWEKALSAFMVDFKVDLYITGSNARLLSSELATYLSGRYIEMDIYPLSFSESLIFKQSRYPQPKLNPKSEFEYFLRLGGFPTLHTASYDIDSAYKIVYDIYSSAILRDTVQRYNIRDVELLERVVKYIFDNIGNNFSAKNVADYFKSQQRKIDLNTVYNYLQALSSAFIIYRVSRYDIKGKEILKTQEKYYLGDQAILYAVMGYKDRLIAGVLENIVYLELRRRNYKVYVGKIGDKEIDFIAELNQKKIYVQVAYKLQEQSTIDREFGSLMAIQDNFPKYVVTMDPLWVDNIEGIQHVYMADFLLMTEF